MEVLIEEFFIVESWKGISVKKSLKQSRVYVKNDAGKWIEYGLLGHVSGCISGLAGSPAELGEEIANACSAKLGRPIRYTGSPTFAEPEEVGIESEDDDE